jgi:CheY-specific phosphatase CheX
MQDQKAATLATIFSEVLQNLAFMFSDDDEAEAAPSDHWLETQIGYTGPRRGSLRLRCPRDFSVLLAGNLLGVDPQADDSEQQACDAVKEFMNILCGQLITAVHGTEDVFDLSIPVIREIEDTPDFDDTGGGQAASFIVQGHPLQVVYHDDA